MRLTTLLSLALPVLTGFTPLATALPQPRDEIILATVITEGTHQVPQNPPDQPGMHMKSFAGDANVDGSCKEAILRPAHNGEGTGDKYHAGKYSDAWCSASLGALSQDGLLINFDSLRWQVSGLLP